MPGFPKGLPQKATAALLAAALIATTPGPYAYQALAASRAEKGVDAGGISLGGPVRSNNLINPASSHGIGSDRGVLAVPADLANQPLLDLGKIGSAELPVASKNIRLGAGNPALGPGGSDGKLPEKAKFGAASPGSLAPADTAMRAAFRRAVEGLVIRNGEGAAKVIESLGLASLLGSQAFPALQREQLNEADRALPRGRGQGVLPLPRSLADMPARGSAASEGAVNARGSVGGAAGRPDEILTPNSLVPSGKASDGRSTAASDNEKTPAPPVLPSATEGAGSAQKYLQAGHAEQEKLGAGPGDESLVRMTEDLLGNRWIKGRKRATPPGPGAGPPGRITAEWDAERLVLFIAEHFSAAAEEVRTYARERGYALDKQEDRGRLVRDFQWADYLRHRDNFDAMSHEDHKKHQGGLAGNISGWLLGVVARNPYARAAIGLAVPVGWALGLSWLFWPAAIVSGLLAFGKTVSVQRESWRHLANRTYAEGWKGSLQRALEVRAFIRYIFGFAVRFPYELFDMFLIGFFRRNFSYMFRHYNEDFMPLGAGSAKKYLEMAWVEQGRLGARAAVTRTKKLLWDRMDAARAESAGKRLPVKLWAQLTVWSTADGLAQFLTRRFTLAVKSAIALGVIFALSSMTPTAWIMGLKLTDISLLNSVLSLAMHGTTSAAGLILGHTGAGIVQAVWSHLIPELVVGKILNTLLLSTFLTFSSAHRQRLLQAYPGDYARVRRLTGWASLWNVEAWFERIKTFLSGVFWRQNLSSFMGLMTVGAEIAAILNYGGAIDGLFNQAYHTHTPSWVQAHVGKDFKLFTNAFAAVEGSAGQSPIPFGGAITWGNLLLYKAQNLVGFNITDHVAGALLHGIGFVAPGAVLPLAHGFHPSSGGTSYAAGLFHRMTDTFHPDRHYKDANEEMKARTDQMLAGAGDWQRAVRDAKDHIALLEQTVAQKQKDLAAAKRSSRPISPEERAAYEKAKRALALADKRRYVEDKLAEKERLTHPKPKSAQYYRGLEELDQYAQKKLLRAAKDGSKSSGYQDSIAALVAGIKAAQWALKEKTDEVASAAGNRSSGGGAPPVDPKVRDQILGLVQKIEGYSARAQAELIQRDAAEKELAIKAQARSRAVRERWKNVMNLDMGLAQMSMTQDLKYSLAVITAAEAQIKNALTLLDSVSQNVTNAQNANAPQLQAAQDAQTNGMKQWNADAQSAVAGDNSDIANMKNLTDQTRSIGDAVQGFQTQTKTVLDQLGGRAKIQSNLVTLLPQVQQWQKTGKPGDTSYLNAADIEADIELVNSSIQKIQTGLHDVQKGIPGAPDEVAAGLLITEAPNDPEVVLKSPTKAYMIDTILPARKGAWQIREAKFESQLATINRRLATTGGYVADDFGVSHPEALPQWRALEQDNIRADIAKLTGSNGLATQIDQLAGSINQALSKGGQGPLPTNLSALVAEGAPGGDSLQPLQDAIKGYADSIAKVKFPASAADGAASDALFQAKIDMVKLGAMLPEMAYTVIKWSESDGYVKAIDNVTPVLQNLRTILGGSNGDGSGGIIRMHKDVIADIDLDIAYLEKGVTLAGNEELIKRKTDLLNRMLPHLQAAQQPLEALQKYQGTSISTTYDLQTGSYAKLFNAELTLYDATVKARESTLPWALAGWGAAVGDMGAGLSGISAQRDVYNKYLTGTLSTVGGMRVAGYSDAKGFHKSVQRYAAEIQARTAPKGTLHDYFDPKIGDIKATEPLYGEEQPFNLNDKIAKYGVEKANRAQQYNARAKEVNDILVKIDTLSSPLDQPTRLLASYRLPIIDVNSPVNFNAMMAVGDNIKSLGDQLLSVGKHYKALSKGADTGNLADGGVAPAGTQSPVTVDAAAQIAFLTVNAGDRLAPSNSAPTDQNSPAAYALARFLFSDAVISASNDALNNQIKPANEFLAKAQKALNDGLTDLDADRKFVSSVGKPLEAWDQVISRKEKIYQELNDFTSQGVIFFGQKLGWDQTTRDTTLLKIQTYYDKLALIYQKGQSVAGNDGDAIDSRRASLKSTYDSLESLKQNINNWLGQLSTKDMSDLRRLGVDMDEIQKKTQSILYANHDFRIAEEIRRDADNNLKWQVMSLKNAYGELEQLLKKNNLNPEDLPADLAERVEKLGPKAGAWMVGPDSTPGAQGLAVGKKDFYYFLHPLLSALHIRENYSEQDIAAMSERIMNHPQDLGQLLPDLRVVSIGADDPDAFYLIYNTDLSTNLGMANSSNIVMGNAAKVGGNDLSGYGYRFMSSVNPRNAPWGDKGVGVQIDSLQGKNWANFIDITFHRPIQNVPVDVTTSKQLEQDRLFIFEDFALMALGDKLYLGVAGFGDFSPADPSHNTSFYGGSAKASYQFTEVAKLTLDQQDILARDPREFFKALNLDFTGYDSGMNLPLDISAKGSDRSYHRTQGGVSIDAKKALGIERADTLTVDFYVARQGGTDDYNQTSGGISVLSGFSIKGDNDKPWMTINNQFRGEGGTKSDYVSDRLTVELPNRGIVFTEAAGWMSSGKLVPYSEVSKKLNDQTNVSIGFGSQFAGQAVPIYPTLGNRIYASFNTTVSLRQVWDAVGRQTSDQLQGGALLGDFQKQIDQFLDSGAKGSEAVAELKSVYAQDVGHQLVSQRVGALVQEIQKLRKAGAFLENSKVHGGAGIVSHGVGQSFSDRAVGGGPMANSYMTLSMSKTPKDEIQSDLLSVYRESLNLRSYLLELTQKWQESVADMVDAQWQFRLAHYASAHAPSETVRKEAEVREAHAVERLSAANIRYNALAGRPPDAGVPFLEKMNARDMGSVAGEIQKILAASDPLTAILGSLSAEELKGRQLDGRDLEKNPFNLLDWVRWVDMFSFSLGTQFAPDSMSNQFIGVDLDIRVPVYDSGKSEREKAYKIDDRATVEQMEGAYREFALKAQQGAVEGGFWARRAQALDGLAPDTAELLSNALSAYRNGLIGEPSLRKTVELWDGVVRQDMQAHANAALAGAQTYLYSTTGLPPAPAQELRVTSIDDAFKAAAGRVPGLAELEDRDQAAALWTEANAHRIQKAYLSWTYGTNLTAYGTNMIPKLDITGLWLMPQLSLDFKSKDLADLEHRSGEAQQEMYRGMKRSLEANWALHFFQNAILYQQSQKLHDATAPDIARLQADFDRAKQDQAAGKATFGEIEQARGALDQARLRSEEYLLAGSRAQAVMNYLLGRPPQSPLDVDLGDMDQALARLKQLTASSVESARAVLDAKVAMARAEEEKADKALRLQNIRVDPAALEVRAIARAVGALSNDSIADPHEVELARAKTLAAERARQDFDAQLDLSRTRALGQWRQAKESGDAADRLLVEAYLASLGISDPEHPAGAPAVQSVPSSFAELAQRVRQSYEETSSRWDPVERSNALAPEADQQGSRGNVRYFYAIRDLGRGDIKKSFIEPWMEIRLSDRSTDPKTLVELAKQEKNLSDRIRRTEASEAAALGDGFVSEFETNVHLLRAAQAAEKNPSAGRPLKSYAEIERVLRQRIDSQAREMATLLRLDPKTPADELARLVPEDPAEASGDWRSIAAAFVGGIKRQSLDFVGREIFEQGTPQSSSEDRAMQQLRADDIARQMTYRGYTPVLVDGYFRGRNVLGGWLEAPDPAAIQAKLSEILSDAVRKELESRGRMRDAVLDVQLLLGGVRGKINAVEKGQSLIEEASQAYLSALGRYENGMGTAAEVASAQDALAQARVDFARNAAGLKSDFVTLVGELETLGQAERIKRSAELHPLDLPEKPAGKSSDEALLKYWSWRMLDEKFQSQVDGVISKMDKPGPGYIPAGDIRRAAEAYRKMTRDSELVRHMDFDGPEKLKLLMDADPQGHREALENFLVPLVGFLRINPNGLNPDARALQTQLREFLGADIEAQVSGATAGQADAIRVLSAMRDGFWHAIGAPPEQEAAFQRLSALDDGRMAARQKLLEDYMQNLHGPADFIMRDRALDEYLKAQEAFDREMIQTFQDPRVRSNPDWANGLHALFNVRAAVAREMDAYRFGRGMAAIDALIWLQESRLAALRFERAAPRDWEPVSAELERLKEIKERWQSDPKELVPLYAITQADAKGERVWEINEWHTGGEITPDPKDPGHFWIKGGEKTWEVRKDADGRMWIQNAGDKKFELIVGVDEAAAKAKDAQSTYIDNTRSLDKFKTLDDHDFALVGLDGARGENGPVRRGLDLKEFRELHSGEGRRVFYFSNTADASGLHRAIHPLEAMKLSPKDVTVIVYDSKDSRIAPDQFPSRESLDSYVKRLASGDDQEKAQALNFARLAVGERGVKALVEEAGHLETRALRAGWLSLKLESYGFAMNGDLPVAAYLTRDEFDRTWKGFYDADGRLSKAREHFKEMEREKAKYQPDQERLEKETAAEQLRLQAVEKASKDGKASQDELRRAQKSASEKMDEFSKANGKFQKAARDRDLAEHDWKEADANLARSKTWRMFKSEGLRLTLDERRALVGVSAEPDYGRDRLRVGLDSPAPGGKLTTVDGDILAATVDGDMNLVKYYQGEGETMKAFQGWTRQGADGANLGKGGDREVSPNIRVVHYADSATGLPVLLNARYLAEAKSGAESELGHVKHWGIYPWHLGDWVKEIVNGVPNSAAEVIGGREPREHGYLGRVNMYKVEGGETDHHGFFYRVGRSVLVLDPFPDPVRWFYDPSQFPQTVRLDSALKPGENIWDKSPIAKEADGEKDVNFGRLGVERRLGQLAEDASNARGRALGYFDGMVHTASVETLRGRAGVYEESSVRDESGRDEKDEENDLVKKMLVKKALDDTALTASPGADGRWSASADGKIMRAEVEEVRRTVSVQAGAADEKIAAEQAAPYAGDVKEARRLANDQQPNLKNSAERGERDYQTSIKRWDDAGDATRRAWDDFQALKLKIGRQDAVEHMIRRLEGEIADSNPELRRLKDHLSELEAHPPRNPAPGRANGNAGAEKQSRHSSAPSHRHSSPRPDTPLPFDRFWAWMPIAAVGLALAAAAAFLKKLFSKTR